MESPKTFRYQKLAHLLREQIMTGFLKPNDFLPTEHQLCEQFRLSRTSVRRALEQLEEEHLIERKPGAGTRVSAHFVMPEDSSRTLHILVPTPFFFVDHHGFDRILEQFRKQHPNVSVNLLKAPGRTDLSESIRSYEKLGVRPDLVLTYDSMLRNVEDMDVFADLETLLEESAGGVYPRLMEGLRHFGGGKIAAPITFSTVFLAYNPDLFESVQVPKPSAGWGKDEFMEAARRLTADGNGDGLTDRYGLMFTSGIARWPVFALQNGLMSPDYPDYEQILLNTSTLIHDMVHRERVAILYDVDSLRTKQHPFRDGKAAMTLTTTFEYSAWIEEGIDFEPQYGPLPFGPCQSTVLMTCQLLIPRSSPKPELAESFIRTALGEEAQAALCSDTPFLSVLPEINRRHVRRERLERQCATEEAMANNYHVHELFPDLETADELTEEMNFFWLALESAPAFARRWKRLVPRVALLENGT